jgi:hypothetical protein
MIKGMLFRLGISLVVLFLFSACTYYRQVFEIDSPDILLFENDYFVDTSSKLDIIYDFWSDGGVPVIEIVNDFSDTILVDFNQSYFTFSGDKFSFATPAQKDSVAEYSKFDGYNVMFDEMPGSVLIPPDSSFVFESIVWNYEWSKDVSKKSASKRYVYSSSPLKMDHIFKYSYMAPELKVDSVIHRMYLSRVEQKELSDYKTYIRSIPLSNKFYITPESQLSPDARSDIAATLLQLFMGLE